MPSLAFAITPEAGLRDTCKHGSSSILVSKIRFNRVHTTQVLQPVHSPGSLVGPDVLRDLESTTYRVGK